MTVIVSPPVPKSDQRFDDWMYLFWKRVFEAISTGGGVPDGGDAGQHLAKLSSTNGDVTWEYPPGAPDLSDYAYLPGRSGGQLLHGGSDDDDTLILQGTAGISGASVDAVVVKAGDSGDVTAIKVRGDGAVAIGGDYDGFFGLPTCITGGTLMTSGTGLLGLVSTAEDQPSGIFLGKVGTVVRVGYLFDQEADASNTGILEIFKDQTLNGYANNAPLIELKDNPHGTGDKLCKLIIATVDSIVRTQFYPRIHDGETGAAYTFDTKEALSDPDTYLLWVRNQSTTKFSIHASGMMFCANAPDYADNASALSGGLVVGNIYRTGGNLKIVI